MLVFLQPQLGQTPRSTDVYWGVGRHLQVPQCFNEVPGVQLARPRRSFWNETVRVIRAAPVWYLAIASTAEKRWVQPLVVLVSLAGETAQQVPTCTNK